MKKKPVFNMTDKKLKQSLEEIKVKVIIVERKKIGLVCFFFFSSVISQLIRNITTQILLRNYSFACLFFFPVLSAGMMLP